MNVAEPFAETLQPRGERSLIGRKFSAITVSACVAGHAIDTRDGSRGCTAAPRPGGTYAVGWVESRIAHPVAYL